jgi:hypothetical protein
MYLEYATCYSLSTEIYRLMENVNFGFQLQVYILSIGAPLQPRGNLESGVGARIPEILKDPADRTLVAVPHS